MCRYKKFQCGVIAWSICADVFHFRLQWEVRMPAISAGKFFGYVNPDPHLESFALFSIRVEGGESVRVVMDTGSNGIVLGSDLVKGGTVMDPQPPAPSYSSSGNSYEGQWVLASVELTGLDGETFTTANPVAVFAATNAPGATTLGAR